MIIEADVVDVIKKDEDISPSPVGSDDEEDEEDVTPSDDDEEIGTNRKKRNCYRCAIERHSIKHMY